jgi:hypothetical protein
MFGQVQLSTNFSQQWTALLINDLANLLIANAALDLSQVATTKADIRRNR